MSARAGEAGRSGRRASSWLGAREWAGAADLWDWADSGCMVAAVGKCRAGVGAERGWLWFNVLVGGWRSGA